MSAYCYKYYCEICDCELQRNKDAEYRVSFCPTDKFAEVSRCQLKIMNADNSFSIKDSLRKHVKNKKDSDTKL